MMTTEAFIAFAKARTRLRRRGDYSGVFRCEYCSMPLDFEDGFRARESLVICSACFRTKTRSKGSSNA